MSSSDILEYQIFALSFREPGAITYFADNLAPVNVGYVHGETGVNQFYQALIDFHNKTGLDPIDPIAFSAWLEVETEIYAALGGAGGVAVFLEMITEIDKLSTPESVTKTILQMANTRRQIDTTQELQLLISKKEHKTDEDYSRISLLTETIRNLSQEIGYDPLEKVQTAAEMADGVEGLWDIPHMLPTPYKQLNRAMGYSENGGPAKGMLTGIIAPSGHGKSTFAKCLANYWLDSGYTVLFINYEEAEKHWKSVLFTQVTGQNVYLGHLLTDAEKTFFNDKFKAKMIDWNQRYLVKHDPDTPYFDDLEKWLRDIIGHDKIKPDAVIIDTLQSMFMKGAGGKPRWGQYEEMVVRLEKLAKDMDAAFILTGQENTNRMKEKREVVIQSDTGGSIVIEQKCAVTIHIVQKSNEDDDGSDTIVELQIPKNRITGGAFTGNPAMLRYVDTSKSFVDFELEDEGRYHQDDDGYDLAEIIGEDFHT